MDCVFSSEGLRVSSNDGLAATFLRADGSLRIKLQQAGITLRMRSRLRENGLLTLDLPGIEHLLHVNGTDKLAFRQNGVVIEPKIGSRLAMFKTRTGPDENDELEIQVVNMPRERQVEQ